MRLPISALILVMAATLGAAQQDDRKPEDRGRVLAEPGEDGVADQ